MLETRLNRTAGGNKGIPVEKIILGEDYTLTINPRLQPDLRNVSLKRTKASIGMVYRKLYENLVQYKDYLDMVIFPEFSSTGRLHYHGTIKINNIIMYLNFVNQLADWAHYEIDTIGPKESDRLTWEKYIQKQKIYMLPLFKDNVFGYPMLISAKMKLIIEPVKVDEEPIKLYEKPKSFFDKWYEEDFKNEEQ